MFTVYVDFASHDDLKDGNVRAGTHEVELLADNRMDAALVAKHMVAAVTGLVVTKSDTYSALDLLFPV